MSTLNLLVKYIICIFFLFLTLKANSQAPSTTKIGCKVGDYVYFQWTGTSHSGSYVFMGYAPYTTEWDTPTRYLRNTTAQNSYPCYSFVSVGGNCKINSSASGAPYTSGTRGQFQFIATNCPLDTNIYYLIAATVVCVFYFRIKGSNQIALNNSINSK